MTKMEIRDKKTFYRIAKDQFGLCNRAVRDFSLLRNEDKKDTDA